MPRRKFLEVAARRLGVAVEDYLHLRTERAAGRVFMDLVEDRVPPVAITRKLTPERFAAEVNDADDAKIFHKSLHSEDLTDVMKPEQAARIAREAWADAEVSGRTTEGLKIPEKFKAMLSPEQFEAARIDGAKSRVFDDALSGKTTPPEIANLLEVETRAHFSYGGKQAAKVELPDDWKEQGLERLFKQAQEMGLLKTLADENIDGARITQELKRFSQNAQDAVALRNGGSKGGKPPQP